jgi:acetyl-CoA carboxylase carboxyl transferase subunit alpha
MLENTWYSVISPESCSSILWRSWDYKQIAADALKLTPKDMLSNKLIDGIIEEPPGGAHTNPDKMFSLLKDELLRHISKLKKVDTETLLEQRLSKFENMGSYK